MTVRFLDLEAAHQELAAELEEASRRVIHSGRYVLGQEVAAFEEEYARYCGARHCVGVGNGLDAIHIALRALDIGPGDEVIVPTHTFIATWLGVTQAGAKVVPVEVNPLTYNLDPSMIERAISPRTRAIMPVHLYGQPAEMTPICALAAAHGLKVVEDAAQSQGATCDGRRTGGVGDVAIHSFYPGKNIGALGDAGAITTNDESVAERARLLRNYGSRVKYEHQLRGFNSRLDELQAAFLRAKLPRLDAWNARRREIAERYLRGLSGQSRFVLPAVARAVEPVWHLFVIRASHRERVRAHLTARGVETLIHYPIPPHLAPAYADSGWTRGSFPIAEAIASEVVSLPMGPHMTHAQVEHVIQSLADSP